MPERHVISVSEDLDVVAVHHDAASEDWLFFCHGLRSDKSGSYESRCERASEAGYNAVRFDFRGCGESDGSFAEATLSARLEDLAAVVEYFHPPSYVLFGSSFGGTVAFHAAREDDRVEAVVTRAPVTYAEAFDGLRAEVECEGEVVFENGDRIDGRFVEALDAYDFGDVAADLEVPVAVVHGAADESVPVAHSFRAARNLETDVLVAKFADEGHRFTRAGERRLQDLAFDWLARQTADER